MTHQLVPDQVLQKAENILFIVQSSISQFVYLNSYLMKFAQKHPHLKVDLWVDEIRRTRCFWKWPKLKKYGLYDWLAACSFLNKIYTQTYSFSLLKKSIEQAKKEKYSLVVILTYNRPTFYINLARCIASQGFIAGITKQTSWYQVRCRKSLRRLNAALDVTKHFDKGHISHQYAAWFNELFNLETYAYQHAPIIAIPRQWISFAKLRFLKWGFDKQTKKFGRVIFINPFSCNASKNWPLEQVLELMQKMKRSEEGQDLCFLVHVDRAHYQQTKTFFDRYSINEAVIFCAEYNFFQISALIAQCDLVISTESFVLHLASALSVSTLALVSSLPKVLPLSLHGGQTFHLQNAAIDAVIKIAQSLLAIKKEALFQPKLQSHRI